MQLIFFSYSPSLSFFHLHPDWKRSQYIWGNDLNTVDVAAAVGSDVAVTSVAASAAATCTVVAGTAVAGTAVASIAVAGTAVVGTAVAGTVVAATVVAAEGPGVGCVSVVAAAVESIHVHWPSEMF